jgi:two-component system, OmpR family, manganese sensing sensor histidine kinase
MSTVSATASRPSVRKLDVYPRALERRLLISFIIVFGAAFLLAAIVVRALFVTNLQQQSFSRLQTLAHAGLRTAVFSGQKLTLDPNDMANSRLLMLREQGLQWFDSRGHLLGSQGLTPSTDAPPQDGYQQIASDNQVFDTLSIAVINPAILRRVGTVRASEPSGVQQANIRGFDSGLFISTLLAIVFGGIAGRALTRRAVRPVAAAFETLGAFTADASHELRGPLAAIASNADAALRDSAANVSSERRRFEAIADAAKQMARLTDDLLLIASADRSLERDLFVVDLRGVIDRVAERYGSRFKEKNIHLSTRVEPETMTYGNPDQIERILANLVENALRYTEPGGSVAVTCQRDRTYISIAVRDDGCGIAPKNLDRVFDRFWRSDQARSREGTGLGLAIARALARRHGGDVRVSSSLGVGTEFVVTLPVRPQAFD